MANTSYDFKKVEDFVALLTDDQMGVLAAYVLGIKRKQGDPWGAPYDAMTPWEQNNVIHKLRPHVDRLLAAAAKRVECVARELDGN